ncbi:MAG: phosphate/phosphite/phosphonate ABC transporter substrate-binding protein [Thermodesulfovibrionales bacterium]|nr:phosphate/phosphite/phosphonate ABC transporter substrate-binding protein [Thermodesulfovibrionales bacterium]
MKRVFLITVSILICLIISGCKETKKSQDAPTYTPVNYEGTPLNIIALPEERAGIIISRFMPIKYHLESVLQRKVNLKIPNDYETALSEIGKDENNIAFLDPAIYCEAKHKYGKKISLILKTVFKEDIKSHSVLVTKETSPITKVADAKGKRLALGSKDSSFSYLIPLSMLNDVNVKLNDLSKVSYLQQEDRVALSILIGDHDIGGLSETVAKKYTNEGLRIIKKSESIPRFAVTVSNNLDSNLKEKVVNALLNLKDLSILTSIDPSIGGFTKAEERDFDVIRAMIFNLTGKDYREYGKGVIKVAILPLYSAITIYERYEPLMRYLSENTGYEFKLYIPKDFEDFISVVKSGKVDFSYQNPYVFSIISKDYDIKPLAITIGEDAEDNKSPNKNLKEDSFRGVIIVRTDSNIKDINDLKGKKVLITSLKSAGGFLSQKIYLKQRGINVEKDMTLIDAKKQENVIFGVYRQEASAGFIRKSALVVWKDAIDMSKIRVLVETEPLPNWPFAVARDLQPQLVSKVKALLVELNNKKILDSAKISGFKPASEEDFNKLRQF